MADFSSYPALDIQQMASPLDMAGKAAALNNAMLQNTGMGLEQHNTRLGIMFRAGMSALNPDGTADPATIKGIITDQLAQHNINASDAAALYANVPGDAKNAGNWVRQGMAGVANSYATTQRHLAYLGTGDGTTVYNDNPGAVGGLTGAPSRVVNGVSADNANAYHTWTSAKGQLRVGTLNQFLADVGANGAAQVSYPGYNADGTPVAGGGQPATAPAAAPAAGAAPGGSQPPVTAPGATPPVTTTPLPPAGAQIAQDTATALGQTNKLTATAPAPGANRMLPPAAAVPPVQPVAGQGAAPAPGAIGTPITIDSQQAIGQTDNATNFQADVNAGSGPQMQTRIDTLHELAGTIDDAFTGGLQSQKSYGEKLLAAIGAPADAGASGSDILHKLSEQAASYLPGAGATDAARSQAMGMTPNGDMTKDAIKTTTAMVLGKAQYDQQYSKDLVAWKAAGGDSTNDYASFKSQYADTHPGPMLYGLMAMREIGDAKGFKRTLDYIRNMPEGHDKDIVRAQIATLQKGQLNGKP